jgi:cytochrome c5
MKTLSERFTPGRRFPHASRWLAGLTLLCAPAFLYGQEGGGRGSAVQLPAGSGRDVLAVACSQCHALSTATLMRDGPAGWKHTVDEMVVKGAQLYPEEAETLIKYMSENFGPGVNKMRTGVLPPGAPLSKAGAMMKVEDVSLPAGTGKELVEARCSLCHDLGRVVSVRRTKAEWEQITKNMNERGLPTTPEQTQAVISYLTAQFGKEAK